jgi:non-structural maintenance of chromosomes element 4
VFPAPIDKDDEGGVGGARGGTSKHQAIFAMDMETWQAIIDAFGIKESMINHREEASTHGPGARGWYS